MSLLSIVRMLGSVFIITLTSLQATESQDSWGWKRPLEANSSKSSAQARTPDAWDHVQTFFLIKSPRMEILWPLWHLCQCSVTLRVKNCLLMFRGNLLIFSLFPLLLVLPMGTTEKSLAPFALHSLPAGIYLWFTPEPSLLHAKQCLVSQPFLIWETLQ